MSLFDQLVAIIFGNEGGFVSAERARELADSGGETNFGVTEVLLRSLGIDKSPSEITQDEAREIYLEHFYKPVSWFEKSDPGLTLLLFDSGVQHSPRRAVRFLQGALGVKVDGVFGPQTRAAAAIANPTLVLLRVAQRRRMLLTRWVQAKPAERMSQVHGVVDRVDRVLEAAYLLNVRS